MKKFATLGLLLVFAVACGDSSPNPASPSVAAPAAVGAAPDGTTLKASAPTPVSPIDNVRVETLTPTLTITNATATFVSATFQYRFQLMTEGGAVVEDSGLVNPNGDSTSFEVTANLESDTTYMWRARAELDGRYGPWSAPASFLSPEAKPFIRMLGGEPEVFDPLTDATFGTVGKRIGSVDLIPGLGARLNTAESRITYVLPDTLEAGEFSMMVTGVDEGSPGDKSKILSMQEGYDDITTNDYRFTVEYRGRDYLGPPGTVSFRIITGEADDEGRIHDLYPRPQVPTSDDLWYFWKVKWADGWANLEIKQDDEFGPTLLDVTIRTDGHPYRPTPHIVHVGAPVGRAGSKNASIPGMIVKNVYVGQRPRPVFPSSR